jgi:hypothetical protein
MAMALFKKLKVVLTDLRLLSGARPCVRVISGFTMAPFVYTGAGRKQNPNETDPGQLNCTKQACAIQWCLSRRNHQEEACRDYIDAWKKCCDKARTAAAIQKHSEQLSTKE